jgi:hypothetical protein
MRTKMRELLWFKYQKRALPRVPNTYPTATATPPRMAAPIYDGTPPDVYVLGIYCRIRDRGVDNEIKIAPKKNPK